MVLTASSVLSPVTGLVCHRRPRKCLPRNLTPASGRQDHTASPSAACIVRQRHCRVHRIPHPTSVTIAIRPQAGRDSDGYRSDLGLKNTRIFLREGLDRRVRDLPARQSVVRVGLKMDPRELPSRQTGRRFRTAARLFRGPELSCEPPDRFRLDRVRYRPGFGMIAFGALERSMFETSRPRRYAFQFHSPLASRTAWALDCSDQ